MIDSITYSKLQWKDRETSLTTPVNSNNLNRIENGVETATNKLNEVIQALNKLTEDVDTIVILDSPDDLPEVGEEKTLYFIK